MTRTFSKWFLPFITLVFIVSCKPAANSELAETRNTTTVNQTEIESVSTLEILQLIRSTGDTYQSESFKTARHCANCMSQRRLDEVAESMLQTQLKFLQGVFVDGAWGDFKMVVYDAPSMLNSSAKGLYDLSQRMNSFLSSYGSMVSEYYTGDDYLGYGSENARNAIDKTVHTLMSMTQFLQTKGYASAEALAKQLYMLYKNPSLLKNAIYDTVRLLSSGLSAGHGFARSISCATIVSLFDEWIPRLMGMVAYEVLIDVVLGFVTVGTAGAAGAVLGAKIGILIAKLLRIAAKMPYIDELIAGLKKLGELVVRLVKRGEDVAPLGKQGDELGSLGKQGDELSDGSRHLDDIENVALSGGCIVGLGLAGDKCVAQEVAEKIKGLTPEYRVPVVLEYARKLAAKFGLVKDSRVSKLNNRHIFKKNNTYYSVDTQHGHFEVCNRKGKHTGSIDMDGVEVPGKIDSTGRHDIWVN